MGSVGSAGEEGAQGPRVQYLTIFESVCWNKSLVLKSNRKTRNLFSFTQS